MKSYMRSSEATYGAICCGGMLETKRKCWVSCNWLPEKSDTTSMAISRDFLSAAACSSSVSFSGQGSTSRSLIRSSHLALMASFLICAAVFLAGFLLVVAFVLEVLVAGFFIADDGPSARREAIAS